VNGLVVWIVLLDDECLDVFLVKTEVFSLLGCDTTLLQTRLGHNSIIAIKHHDRSAADQAWAVAAIGLQHRGYELG
jgi:hypothetical protein